MARPRRSAASITSWSRTEPPGWMMAVEPALAISSTPSGKGKKASEAATVPLSGSSIDGAIDADGATEGGDGIAFERAFVGLGQRRAGGGSGWIGVLDDGAERLIEFLGEVPCGLEVDDVVVGEFFALELAGVRDS